MSSIVDIMFSDIKEIVFSNYRLGASKLNSDLSLPLVLPSTLIISLFLTLPHQPIYNRRLQTILITLNLFQ